MKKNKWVLIFVGIGLLGLMGPLQARGLSLEEQKKIAVQGRNLLLERNYAQAEKILTKMTEDYPDEPIGFFGLMTLYQVHNLENFDYRFDASYRRWDEPGRRLALQVLQKADGDAWSLLLAGGILGASGFYQAHNHHWLKGLRDGSMGFHALKKAYQRDPQLVDALLGIGLYDYWRSYFTRRLVFLPFFPDRRDRARETLALAQQQGIFVGPLAKIASAFIASVENKYQESLDAVGDLMRPYPQNIILKMLRGANLLQLKKYDESIKEFEQILALDPQITKAYLYLGLAYRGKKETEKGDEYLGKFLKLEPQAPYAWRKMARIPAN